MVFACTFANSPTDCGFDLQARVASRASLVNFGRDGGTAVRLHTEPGDNNVAGSGSWERADLALPVSLTGCSEGREQWWEHSILFPDDFVVPTAGVVLDFHHASGGGQANFHVDSMRDSAGGMRLRGYGGQRRDSNEYMVSLGPIERNVWYDIIYNVKWSSGSDGFFNAWVNGKQVLAHNGPTLYVDTDCYLKLANYHEPTGQPSSVIHDRVIRYDVGGQ
jgi:hypothetical protein